MVSYLKMRLTNDILIFLLFICSSVAEADFDEEESESDYKPTVNDVKIQPPPRDEVIKNSNVDEVIDKEDIGKIDQNGPLKKPSAEKEKNKKSLSPQPKGIEDKPNSVAPVKKRPASTKKTKNKTPKVHVEKPIKIKSDGLKGSRANGKVFLKDNVRINKGDLEISCDDATIFFDNKNDDVEKVVARGNVKFIKIDQITSAKLRAFARQVIYEQKKGIVTLIGNVSIYRGDDLIKGSRLIYDVNTGWITGKKVDGVVSPKN